jgi:hypothetical protein
VAALERARASLTAADNPVQDEVSAIRLNPESVRNVAAFRRFAMKKISKVVTGAAAAAVMSVSFAAPADAQYRYRDRYDRGIDTGDVITGVAILGGNRCHRFGAGPRRPELRLQQSLSLPRWLIRRRSTACGYQAERYGRAAASASPT